MHYLHFESIIENKTLQHRGQWFATVVFRFRNNTRFFPHRQLPLWVDENKSALPFCRTIDSRKRPSIQRILLLSSKVPEEGRPLSTGPRRDRCKISARYPRRNIEKPGRKIKPRIICQDLSGRTKKIYEACEREGPTRS